MTSEPLLRTRVLIVGAGPVGLALAIELGHRSVPCLLIERNDRVGYAPRAKTTNVRTREHFRRWGIAEDLRAASPLGVCYPSNVVFCTRLAGHELTRFENAFYCAPGRNPLYSEHSQWIPQYIVEEVMRRHAQSLPGVQLRFNCEFAQFEQDGERVRARLRDRSASADFNVEADYLVGADGARSMVRDGLGAKLVGTHGLSRNFNVVFRAPGLAQAHTLGPAIMYWQVNAEVPSLIGPMDQGDKWFFMPTGVPSDFKLSVADAPALIRRATGINLPYEVLSTDEWTASSFLADRYRDRRVFLAGDACHQHPPFGGYGMNMGIADGVDLGWKLAALIQGWGGAGLLDSYERERRPAHQFILDEAVANHSTLGNQLSEPGLEDANERGAALRRKVGTRIQAAKLREFTTLGVMLGCSYDDSPAIVSDGSPKPAPDFINYVPSSRPGSLAPHAWLHDGSSLYDSFGPGFTLLIHPQTSPAEVETARLQARSARVPLEVVQPHEPSIAELYPKRFTLIRPDQYVAWRGDTWPHASAVLFERVTGRSSLSGPSPMNSKPDTTRRPGVVAVHSIHRFAFSVPDLSVARGFFSAFGLDVRQIGQRLDLYTVGHSHCWGSIYEAGARKRLQYVSYGVFAEDYPEFSRRIEKDGLAIEPHPLAHDGEGLWLRDPDGIATQLIISPKVSPSEKTRPSPRPSVAVGHGAAPSRSKVEQVRPRYLSHILRFTPDVTRMAGFCNRVLGLRLTDWAEDIIAFLHTPHGSDHHLAAFSKSHAPGIHHSSWDVGSLDEVGFGAEQMRHAGWGSGWGVGRHVLGSNYFNYVQDPWESFCEYSYDIDFVPADLDWPAANHPPADSLYVWGPPPPDNFITNHEQ